MTDEQQRLAAAWQAALLAEHEAEAEYRAAESTKVLAEKHYWDASKDHDAAMEKSAEAARAFRESLLQP